MKINLFASKSYVFIFLLNTINKAGRVGGLQPVGIATPSNRLEKFTTLNRYDDILTVVERM